MAEELQESTDYLGRTSPVTLSGKASLPAGGAPVGVATGPQSTATGMAATGAGSSPLGEPGGGPVGAGGPTLDGSPLLGGALLGSRLATLADRFGLFPSVPAPGSFARPEAIEEAWQAFRSGERGDFGSAGGLGAFGNAETLGQVSGGELALGAEAGGAAGAGAAIPGEALALTGWQALGQAAPYWAALTWAVDLLGEGKIPFQDIIEMIAPGTFGPSEEWLSFGSRLGETFQGYERADQTLAGALVGASGQQEIEAAVSAWQASTRQQGGPLDIGDLPGATGTRHEGRLNTDFSVETYGLREMLQAALAGAAPQERIAALMRAAQGRRDTLAAQKATLEADQAKIYGTPEEQGFAAQMSSAGGGGDGGAE